MMYRSWGLWSVLAATACQPTAPLAPPAMGEAATPASAAPLAMQDPVEALVGVVTTRRSVVVAAEFEGRVTRVLVFSGQRVRAGDPLIELDDSQLRQRVAAAQHGEEAARSKLTGQRAIAAAARRRLSIERELYEQGVQAREVVAGARVEVTSSQASASAAKAEYSAASAARADLERQLVQATYLSPIDGVVGTVGVKEGEITHPGTRIARVFDPQELRLQFELPRHRRAEIAIGSIVQAQAEGVEIRARVVEISSDLEPPLQFAIASAEVISDVRKLEIANRVGAEVRVHIAAPTKSVATTPNRP
jgi:RND family efflux transporter MFP subunit